MIDMNKKGFVMHPVLLDNGKSNDEK